MTMDSRGSPPRASTSGCASTRAESTSASTATATATATSGPESRSGSNAEATPSHQRLYFGYGSNLWRAQMAQRCPRSPYVGIARLRGYRWLINERGYANVERVHDGSLNDGIASRESAAKHSYNDNYGDTRSSPYHPRAEQASESSASASAIAAADNREVDGHAVWGLVYDLSSEDEARLDVNEGVPVAYVKEMLDAELWRASDDADDDAAAAAAAVIGANAGPGERPAASSPVSPLSLSSSSTRPMLVYINHEQVRPSMPKAEYVYRMNRGIEDALAAGVPLRYVLTVLRRFIPELESLDRSVEDKALRQAVHFVDENER